MFRQKMYVTEEDIVQLIMLRNITGLTQLKVSIETGITQTAISNIEAGKVVPHENTYKKLYDFYQKEISKNREDCLKRAQEMREDVLNKLLVLDKFFLQNEKKE